MFGVIKRFLLTHKMKKIWLIIISLVFLVAPTFAYEFSTTYNPFTGRLDYHVTENFTGYNVTASYFFGDGSQLIGISMGGGNTTSEIFGVCDNSTFLKSYIENDPNWLANISSYYIKTEITGLKYYNSSTWNNLWNITSGNTTSEIFAVCDNSTFLKSESDPNWLANMSKYYIKTDITGLSYYNSSTWNNIWNASTGNSTSEIFGVCDNSTFLKNEVNWNANISNYYTIFNISGLNYFNSSTWDNTWNASIGGGNTTSEIFAVCDNSTFVKIGDMNYTNFILKNQTNNVTGDFKLVDNSSSVEVFFESGYLVVSG